MSIVKTLVSLFDYSGNWSEPYKESGFDVKCVDIKCGDDVLDITKHTFPRIDGLLAAPPCTDFSISGAQYWNKKDVDGRTKKSLELVYQVIRIVEWYRPDFWCLENPVGRLNKLVPGLSMFGPWYFQPHWYGDAYTKKTGLWGEFNRNLQRNNVEPIRVCNQGSWVQKLGGKSEKTKILRSITPLGFSKAFFDANNWKYDQLYTPLNPQQTN